MKKFFLAAALLTATPALAAEPATFVLPISLVNEMANYLATKPFADVASMLIQLRQCVAAQMPNAQGVIVSQEGQCDAVRAALASAPGQRIVPNVPAPVLAPSTPAVPPPAPAPATPAPATPAPSPPQTNDGSKTSPG